MLGIERRILGERAGRWGDHAAILAHPAKPLHAHEVAGATPEAREESTIAATAKDLAFIKARFAEAYVQ